MFGHIFAVFLSLFDALCQKVFNLAVDGAEVVLRPGCQRIVQIFGKTERNLFLFVICHILNNHAPFAGTVGATFRRESGCHLSPGQWVPPFTGTVDAASSRNRGRQ